MKRLITYLTTTIVIVVPFIEGCTITLPVIREIADIEARKLQGTLEKIAKIENLKIEGPSGKIPIRIYTPEDEGPFPLLIYLHGGGFVFGSPDACDYVCSYFANRVGCVVISVDYRLAPKYKFPAAVEDVYTAAQWTAANADLINGDSTRIAVGGESAGGNLAAVLCLMARDRGGPHLVFQLLACPTTNIASLGTVDYPEFVKGPGLTKSRHVWLRKKYLKSKKDWENPYVSPLLADNLSNLPPALVITAELDVLRDEGEAYANRLRQEGVPARYLRCAGRSHMDVIDALYEAASSLRSAFAQ